MRAVGLLALALTCGCGTAFRVAAGPLFGPDGDIGAELRIEGTIFPREPRPTPRPEPELPSVRSERGPSNLVKGTLVAAAAGGLAPEHDGFVSVAAGLDLLVIYPDDDDPSVAATFYRFGPRVGWDGTLTFGPHLAFGVRSWRRGDRAITLGGYFGCDFAASDEHRGGCSWGPAVDVMALH